MVGLYNRPTVSRSRLVHVNSVFTAGSPGRGLCRSFCWGRSELLGTYRRNYHLSCNRSIGKRREIRQRHLVPLAPRVSSCRTHARYAGNDAARRHGSHAHWAGGHVIPCTHRAHWAGGHVLPGTRHAH